MIIALTAGAVLVMWLGERITESGIGMVFPLSCST